MAYEVMACIVMTHEVMAYIAMAYTVMTYKVTANKVMAYSLSPRCTDGEAGIVWRRRDPDFVGAAKSRRDQRVELDVECAAANHRTTEHRIAAMSVVIVRRTITR